MKDLFENPEKLSKEVQAIINKYCIGDKINVSTWQSFNIELEKHGYICDLGADFTPCDLKKIKKCSHCKVNEAQKAHKCPYKTDVMDIQNKCNCCIECTTECSQNV